MTFKVGDKVRYSYYGSEPRHHGTVTKDQGAGFYTVDWEGIGVQTALGEVLVTDNTKEVPSGASTTLSDGGPSDYYDFDPGWITLNDYIEYKSEKQWGKFSFHWANVTKALCRWGDKDGTSCEYDAKKVIYSGCRVLKAIIGVENLRTYLQKLLDDPQFQTKGTN